MVVAGNAYSGKVNGVLSSWMKHVPNAFVVPTYNGRLQGYDHVRAMARLVQLAPDAKWCVCLFH